MAYTGTIYIKDIDGNPAGVGQPVSIAEHHPLATQPILALPRGT